MSIHVANPENERMIHNYLQCLALKPEPRNFWKVLLCNTFQKFLVVCLLGNCCNFTRSVVSISGRSLRKYLSISFVKILVAILHLLLLFYQITNLASYCPTYLSHISQVTLHEAVLENIPAPSSNRQCDR